MTQLFLEKSPFLKSAIGLALVSLFLLSITDLASWASSGRWFDPPAVYTVQNIKPIFSRDHLVGTPQLSPDGNFIAHRLSNSSFDNAYLAITDLKSGETQSLAEMRFIDGIKWSPSGDSIVYQYRVGESCQIRLLKLATNKNVIDNRLLTDCIAQSGVLSFAWFSEHQFYVNLVDGPSAGLSIHQLYSFDIHTNRLTKRLTAKDQGIGFFSLEYDASIDTLYMLMTSNFVTTDIYSYHQEKLSKLKTVEYPVKYFAAANNQFIYKDDRNNFVINQPAGNFTDQKILLPSTMAPVMKPHIVGNKLTFLAGNTHGFELKKWGNEQLTTVDLEKFKPSVLARYKNSLIFASGQTGIYQLYRLHQDNKVIKISNMTTNEYIQHVKVAEAGDVFAVSYRNRVDFYHYRQDELTLLHSLTGYGDGVLSADGHKVLVSQRENGETTGTVIELRLSDYQPTGLKINDAIMAMYYQGGVIYVNKNQQLLSYAGDKSAVLAIDINIRALNQATIYENKLYYIAKQQNQSTLFSYDFINGALAQIHLDGADPTRVEVIKGEIYIRTRQLLKPKIMVGELVRN